MGASDEVEEKERRRRCVLNIGVMLGVVSLDFHRQTKPTCLRQNQRAASVVQS